MQVTRTRSSGRPMAASASSRLLTAGSLRKGGELESVRNCAVKAGSRRTSAASSAIDG